MLYHLTTPPSVKDQHLHPGWKGVWWYVMLTYSLPSKESQRLNFGFLVLGVFLTVLTVLGQEKSFFDLLLVSGRVVIHMMADGTFQAN